MRQSLRAFCLTCLGTYACKEVGGRASERWTDMHPPAVAVRSQLVRKSEVQRVDLLPENFQRALLESDAPDGPRFHWEPRDGARVQAAREPLQQRHEIREVLKVSEEGNISVWTSRLLLEGQAMCRAQAAAIGGNAVLHYNVDQIIVNNMAHKMRVYSVLMVTGDAVRIQADPNARDVP